MSGVNLNKVREAVKAVKKPMIIVYFPERPLVFTIDRGATFKYERRDFPINEFTDVKDVTKWIEDDKFLYPVEFMRLEMNADIQTIQFNNLIPWIKVEAVSIDHRFVSEGGAL